MQTSSSIIDWEIECEFLYEENMFFKKKMTKKMKPKFQLGNEEF